MKNSEDCWRVMIQSAGRVETVSKHLAGRAGSVQEMFEISRVGSGGVRMFSNITGRAGSPWPYPTLSDPIRPYPTRESTRESSREKPWK